MLKFSAKPSLLLIAAFLLAGATPLCACRSMQAAQADGSGSATTTATPPCCMQQNQQKQQKPACHTVPTPASDHDEEPAESPADCPHCQIGPIDVLAHDEWVAPLPSGRDSLAMDLAVYAAQPLPDGLTQPSVWFAMLASHAAGPAPSHADSLLARACLLTL